MEQGVQVERPDFWVLRVSLLGLSPARLEELVTWMHNCGVRDIASEASISERYARQRYAARGVGSQAKKYVNLMGAPGDRANMRWAEETLKGMGFGASITPGPLMLATTGGSSPRRTAMPLSVGSAFAPTKEMLERAYAAVNIDPLRPDPDLDLWPGEKPKWSTHALRRLANTTAQKYKELSGATSDEIDIYFGWHEKILLRAMQVHYASMSMRERMKKAKITGFM